MILLVVAGGVPALAVGRQAGSTPRQTIRAVPGFTKFQQWALLVRNHMPRQWDDAARAVAAWSPDDLQLLRRDLEVVAEVLALQSTPSDPAKFGTLRPNWTAPRQAASVRSISASLLAGRAPSRVVRLEDVPALLEMPAAEFYRDPAILDSDQGVFGSALRELEPAVTRFMARAAMLHADVAVLAPPGTSMPSPAASGANGSQPVIRLLDGQAAGFDDDPLHWEIARFALDAMRPDPAAAAGVRQFVQVWYRATAAYQLSRRSYGYVMPHLERARTKLVDDAQIQLYSGVALENLAAPTVQAAVQSMGATAARLDVSPIRESLQQAEGYFQRAIDLDPTLTVALVHHARVIGLLGRHQAAVGELRRAMPSVADPLLAYYANLFLGAEEQSLGHLEAARESYQQAAVRWPRAQSPYLALSQLAWQNADRVNARSAFDELARLSAGEFDRLDPWWTYDVSTVPNPDALMAELLAVANRERGR